MVLHVSLMELLILVIYPHRNFCSSVLLKNPNSAVKIMTIKQILESHMQVLKMCAWVFWKEANSLQWPLLPSVQFRSILSFSPSHACQIPLQDACVMAPGSCLLWEVCPPEQPEIPGNLGRGAPHSYSAPWLQMVGWTLDGSAVHGQLLIQRCYNAEVQGKFSEQDIFK